MIHMLSTGLFTRIANNDAAKSKSGESPAKNSCLLRFIFPVYRRLCASYSWQAFRNIETQLSPIIDN
jgi:hypothetical protein